MTPKLKIILLFLKFDLNTLADVNFNFIAITYEKEEDVTNFLKNIRINLYI